MFRPSRHFGTGTAGFSECKYTVYLVIFQYRNAFFILFSSHRKPRDPTDKAVSDNRIANIEPLYARFAQNDGAALNAAASPSTTWSKAPCTLEPIIMRIIMLSSMRSTSLMRVSQSPAACS